jgi:hypothetical protein
MEEEKEISSVSESDTHYFISTEGSGFGIDKKYCGTTVPQVGDKIICQTKNISTVRGIILNGVQLYYKSDKQLEDEHKAWCEEYHRKQEEDFKKNQAKLDKDFNELPKPFQDRIQRYRDNNPDFRVEYEPYEMFCCTEAVKMAKALKTPEAVEAFKELSYEEQRKLVPFDEGHSGNTFSTAVGLAYWYLKDHSIVAQMHAALSPLVGSLSSGDIDVVEHQIEKRGW